LNTTSSTAGWLVPPLSLLSKKIVVLAGLAAIRNPLFVFGAFNHAFTWLVTSTVTVALAVVTATPSCTAAPAPTPLLPFTVASLHGVFAA
jgi:hypothetical protein